MTTEKGKSGFDIKHYIQSVLPLQYVNAEPQVASFIELMANALDASRIDLYPNLRKKDISRIEINIDNTKGLLEVCDYGIGMDKEQLKTYHDFITSGKKSGKEIGFAGQGAKLALKFCSKVITETWSDTYKGYSEWQLIENEAPWEITDDRLLHLDHHGTKISLCLNSECKEFFTENLIRSILAEHYLPLFDPWLLKIYAGESPLFEDSKSALKVYKPIYSKGLEFYLNGKALSRESINDVLKRRDEVSLSLHGKPKARGFFGIAEDGIPEWLQGIAVSTYGKIIERTFFKKEPREKQIITGWIEAPYLIEAVTTDKCRFQKGNKTWESFSRKAQAEFSRWLDKIGLMDKTPESKPDFSNIEKEINSILRDLPELTFFSARTRKDVAITDENGELRNMGEGTQKVRGTKGGETDGKGVSIFPGDEPGQAPTLELGADTPATPHPRTIRGGIHITLVQRDDIEKEAWFDGEIINLNESHPAYKRAKRERLDNYHLLKSAVLSLIEHKLEKDPTPSYREAFELSQRFFRMWGEK